MCKYYLFKELKILKFIEYSEKVFSRTWNPTEFGKLGISRHTPGVCSGPVPQQGLQVARMLFSAPTVQRGSSGHPGRCAGPCRRQPAPAQVPRELPEPLHGPGAAAEGEHQPEGDGQGGHTAAGPQPPLAHTGQRNLPRGDGAACWESENVSQSDGH